MPKVRKDVGSIPDKIIAFSSWANPSSSTVASDLKRSLTNEYQNNFLGDKARPECKADNHTNICKLTV
jgi:hypothetical protein